MNKLLITLAMITGLGACATETLSLTEYEKQLDWVHQAKAKKDADEAISRGDLRLFAIAQRAIIIPGIDSEIKDQYESKCGIKMLPGMTDAVKSQQHLDLMKKARSYAVEYNTLIKSECGLE